MKRVPVRSVAPGRALLLGIALTLAGSCAAIPAEPNAVGRGEITTTSGVRYEDTFLGSGPAAVVGDEVVFDYTVWLANGERVDSTIDRGAPVRVILGSAALKGWNDGLLGIQAQGTRRVVVPPELAYGAEGLPGVVPPNAVLTFDVRAISVTRPTK